MKRRIIEQSNNWSSPKIFYDRLVDKYGEMRDVCPIALEITDENDSLNLQNPWGKVNFCNPPYSLKEKTGFVERAVSEWQVNGNVTILLLPVSTSTKLYHHIIKPNAHDIEFLEGRLKFEGLDTKGNHVNPGVGINSIPDSEHLPKIYASGQFDSMIVVIGAI